MRRRKVAAYVLVGTLALPCALFSGCSCLEIPLGVETDELGLERSTFFETDDIGLVTDIVIGDFTANDGEEVAIAGSHGAVITDMAGKPLHQVSFVSPGPYYYVLRTGAQSLPQYAAIITIEQDVCGDEECPPLKALRIVGQDGATQFETPVHTYYERRAPGRSADYVGDDDVDELITATDTGVQVLSQGGEVVWESEPLWEGAVPYAIQDAYALFDPSKQMAAIIAIRIGDDAYDENGNVLIESSNGYWPVFVTGLPGEEPESQGLLDFRAYSNAQLIRLNGDVVRTLEWPDGLQSFGRGVGVRLSDDGPALYAVNTDFHDPFGGGRSSFIIFDEAGAVVYRETIAGASGGIAAFAKDDTGNTQRLLVGADGVVFEYELSQE